MVGAIESFRNWRKICTVQGSCRECPIYDACGYMKGSKPSAVKDEDILELVRQIDAWARRMEGQNGENISKKRQEDS